MPFEDTNPWARYFSHEAKEKAAKRKKAASKRKATVEYKLAKPKAILDFEAELVRTGCKPPAGGYDDRTANGLTNFMLDFLRHYGYYGARINIGGIYMADKGKYRESGSTKGVADVIACVRGHFCQFEVKAGKDRPRPDQLEQKQLTEFAGGSYEFIHNATEFVDILREILKKTYDLPIQ